MRWFDQGIAAAVDKAKRENSIFVVYIEGEINFEDFINFVMN